MVGMKAEYEHVVAVARENAARLGVPEDSVGFAAAVKVAVELVYPLTGMEVAAIRGALFDIMEPALAAGARTHDEIRDWLGRNGNVGAFDNLTCGRNAWVVLRDPYPA